MDALTRSIAIGTAGALTTNVAHEVVRRLTPDAPRVDMLGMQGIARIVRDTGGTPPRGSRLYYTTLAFDLLSNGTMFALAARVPKAASLAAGAGIGLLAGLGAAYLPGPLGFSAETTGRTPATRALSVALYAAGGIAAGATAAAL